MTTENLKPGNLSTDLADIIKSLNFPNRLMTDVEVAKIKNCSFQKLRNDRHLRRGLPYIKTGRSVRYTRYGFPDGFESSQGDPQELKKQEAVYPKEIEERVIQDLRNKV